MMLRVASANSNWFKDIHGIRHGVEQEAISKMSPRYLDICWPYNGIDWSFATGRNQFLIWFNSGFPVVCIECWDGPDSICPHVEFSEGPVRDRAKSVVQVIRMGLL